ncbi:hypothetical protein AB0J80_12290 [Actinoplanes sp. NPDC049548]|uniref:hypothetical protein n=1 Tax=Actinoplanes sp. NPDC049548 TaxID=3155152 RepID=UPI00342CBA4C
MSYRSDSERTGSLGWRDPFGASRPQLAELFATWGGASFNSGLYRIHSSRTFEAASRAIETYLPKMHRTAVPFGFDWLGRNYAIAPGGGSSPVLIVDLGEGRVFEVPVDLEAFHDVELVDYPNEALAADWFSDWRSSHEGVALCFSECVGYRTPIFLGGTDDDENLEVSDIDVYWSMTSQLYGKVKNLPEGTPIDGISIEE